MHRQDALNIGTGALTFNGGMLDTTDSFESSNSAILEEGGGRLETDEDHAGRL
ncbi:hypothetical protein HGO34_06695 [Agrobacterium vitis]|uniref:Uncharacterized protein n=1 Tax=Agrobacterium vitis TaxID=373 RepID=A0AAE4WBM5_AGRVI|nr:hypothetical protein [Agrobacterium vitis]MCM2439409.1 hypothetical protein [Agrobacterium vitis]MUZ57687.1 hypothetical protein [Agrobacterium vitis]